MRSGLRAYTFVPLRDELAIQEFVARYAAYASRTPGPPLQREHFPAVPDLWAAFDGHGTMLGGFELARGSAMACPAFFDWDQSPLARVAASASVELNCVWLLPELRGTWRSIRFWRGLAYALERLPETYVIFAIDARKPGLERFYRPIIAGRAYSGPFASERVPAGSIYWTTPRHFRYLGLYYLRIYVTRALTSSPGSAATARSTPRSSART